MQTARDPCTAALFSFLGRGVPGQPPTLREKIRPNPPTPMGGGRPATPLRPWAGICIIAGVLPASGYRAVANGEGGLAVNSPGPGLQHLYWRDVCIC
jgi:hypothetical protein